ncbi:serpin-ZX-like [Durio zibethinus]|uniref:Serpin-ZX-like n=1 Tax=Durio zibethinus TaxID=66656 RepID=A0A6P6AVA0_DURZI|nr:serpin-ZX-like [Durio zibethinus]
MFPYSLSNRPFILLDIFRRLGLTKVKSIFFLLLLRLELFSSRVQIATMDLRESIRTQTEVALSLTRNILQTEAKDSNLVFSPLSIHVVLGLIAAGSKGPTLDQLLSFLKSKSNDHLSSFSSELVSVVFADGSPVGGPRLSFANGVWVDKSLPLKPSFKQVADNVYNATSNQVDFQTKAVQVAGEVNLWAEKETSGLIKEVLPPGAVDGSTKLIFTNALYFKGAWNETFDASKTKDYDFHLINGSSVKVPFMTSKKKQTVSAYDGFKVLRLPYKQGGDKRRFSMYFFLPDAKDRLPALVEKVSSESGFLERHLPYEPVEVGEFRIPRFKISFGLEASVVLKRLGLVLPFSGEGGLTEMVDSPLVQNLYVSNIFHKSFIEVNEEGTEAAAATASLIKLRGLLVQENIDFVADHPFLFLVREDVTGVVLFIGHVLNPLESL